jgi:glycosyl transferase family 25
MKQIFDYFDRTYIINLVDRTDRRQQVEQEFKSIGIHIPNDKIRYFSAQRMTERGGFVDVGTRGNYDSHRAVLKLAVQDRLSNILVVEDDVSFRSIGNAFKDQLVAQLSRQEWDVVCLGYAKPDDKSLTGDTLQQLQTDFLGAQLYGVNQTFIPRMIDYMNDCETRKHGDPFGCPMPADGIYNQARRVLPDVRMLISGANLAHQRSSRTDVARPSIIDRAPLLRMFAPQIRNFKHRLRMMHDRSKLARR